MHLSGKLKTAVVRLVTTGAYCCHDSAQPKITVLITCWIFPWFPCPIFCFCWLLFWLPPWLPCAVLKSGVWLVVVCAVLQPCFGPGFLPGFCALFTGFWLLYSVFYPGVCPSVFPGFCISFFPGLCPSFCPRPDVSTGFCRGFCPSFFPGICSGFCLDFCFCFYAFLWPYF